MSFLLSSIEMGQAIMVDDVQYQVIGISVYESRRAGVMLREMKGPKTITLHLNDTIEVTDETPVKEVVGWLVG